MRGVDIRACDCVEIAPSYDHGEITALLGASVCHTLLCLIAAGGH